MAVFIQPDFTINYENKNFPKAYFPCNDCSFYIIVQIKGKGIVKTSSKILHIDSGDILITNQKEDFMFSNNNANCMYLAIGFDAKTVHYIDSDNDMLVPFYENDIKIYNELADKPAVSAIINKIVDDLDAHKCRYYQLCNLLNLVGEIYSEYEKSHDTSFKTDSKYAKIAEYIDKHLFEKITIKQVAEKTFISPRCVVNTVKREYKANFHEYINDSRLYASIRLMRSTSLSLLEISQKCGFDAYSTYYRAFKKKFALTPAEFRKQI